MIPFSIFLLLLLLSLSAPAAGTCFSSSSFPRPSVEQFQTWYPKYRNILSNISTGSCNVSLRNYQSSFTAPVGSVEASYLLCTCYLHEACILDTISADVMANFNSAAVILGLMPTILASVSPSVAEISLLSAHRPLLSFLISMGAPAIWPTRVFEYTNPVQALGGHERIVIKQLRPWIAILLSVGQYIFALGCVVNIVTTSIQLGRNSILTWGCTTTFTPLLWTTLPSIIHLVAAASYIITLRIDQNSQQGASAIEDSWLTLPARAWKSETTICANRQKSRSNDGKVKVQRLAILLNVAAGALGFVHITFGIIVFSSLQLISVWDVLNQVLWRYILSTAVCRLILLIELIGLRTGEGGENDE